MRSQQEPVSYVRRNGELEGLLAELVDEVDHWKSTSETLARELETLRGEREELVAEQRVAESWRRGLFEELEEYARNDPLVARQSTRPERNPIRGIVIGLPIGGLLWGLLASLGFLLFWIVG